MRSRGSRTCCISRRTSIHPAIRAGYAAIVELLVDPQEALVLMGSSTRRRSRTGWLEGDDWSKSQKRLDDQELQSAEEVGFEPTVPRTVHRFSRPALSTTQAPLRVCGDGNTRMKAVHDVLTRPLPLAHTLRNGLRSWKNSLSDFAAVRRQHARGDLAPVIEPGVGNQPIKALAAAGLGIVAP